MVERERNRKSKKQKAGEEIGARQQQGNLRKKGTG